ncbi:MAG: PAS domain-containing protein, partial [Alphaproteobacteria bacterium]|nr:PAS domain-containing protein [Alphaproteobacteria bacterium]
MSNEHVDLKVLFEALPNPLMVLDSNNKIRMVNAAAEDFFQASASVLCRLTLDDMVPFASPALEAVGQVRAQGGVVNEYAIGIGTPRWAGERVVDLQTTLVDENLGHVMVMLFRRSMAHKMDSQLFHQGAARAVSSMAAMMAHEIKNPLSGIRGAAQLLEPTLDDVDRPLAKLICDETDRIRDLVDQMEVFSDERPLERQPINIHVVLDRVKQLIEAGFQDGLTILEDYDPSLPPVNGNHDQLVQVFLNLAK